MEGDQCDKNILNLCEITNFTYLFAFLLLSFSTVITGIEALKTDDLTYRTVLTIETFISLVAGYVYYKYLSNAESRQGIRNCNTYDSSCNLVCEDEEMRVTGYRYLDWIITTPFLLLALCILLNRGDDFPWGPFGLIVLFNEIMLISGYLAETGRVNKLLGWLIGTIALIVVFIIIYVTFNPYNQPLFWVFLIVWSLYGIVFFLPYQLKTISYNILDVIAKAGFGIWTWLIAVNLVAPGPTN